MHVGIIIDRRLCLARVTGLGQDPCEMSDVGRETQGPTWTRTKYHKAPRECLRRVGPGDESPRRSMSLVWNIRT